MITGDILMSALGGALVIWATAHTYLYRRSQ